jgi:glycerophosphoryl diester phosphodiesterase
VRLRAQNGRVAVVAHRGVPGVAPENTLAGIEAALALGVDVVEVDVSFRDGELFLAHSPEVALPDSPGLAEALRFFADHAAHGTTIQVDLKARGVEERVVEAVATHGLLERAFVTSTFADVLRAVRRLEPALATGLAYPYDRTGLGERGLLPPPVTRAALAAMRLVLPHRAVRLARAARADLLMLDHRVVSARTVGRCQERGLAVYAWTVNDRDALDRVLALGVDGVVTDDPELVLGRR